MWINTELFKLKKEDFPQLPPELSYESQLWWKEQRRRCIEGYWVGGRYMPGNYYFYLNFWTIIKNDKRGNRVYGRPDLWDIHWEVAYGISEARGLAGFSEQKEIKQLLSIIDNLNYEEKQAALKQLPNIREVLYNSNKNLGTPVYLHRSKDYMLMGARGSGKSMYLAGAEIGHQFLFDGLKAYKPMSEVNESSSTVVGAGHTEFSGKLLLKVKMGFDYLPGAITINGEYYPPPFSKQFKGTLGNNTIKVIAEYDIKEGENWVTKGTKSNITHVAFKDNPFAAAGESTNTLIIDECGLCGNLLAIEEATIDCVERSGNRFGIRIYAGTGGEMDEGTIPSSMMFVNPEQHDLVTYEDVYEYKGNIAYFIPKNRALDVYKDKDGNTIEPDATNYVEKKREVIRKESHSSSKLDAEKQNNPMVPSEMFLSRTGNIFPKGELQSHLASLRTDEKYKGCGDVGEFIYNDDGKLIYNLLEQDRYITFFPHDPKVHDVRGAWIIWEYPETNSEGKVPQNLYIAGNDPYDHDQSGTVSLGATFIYKKIFTTTGTQETIVAEYTGRHEKGSNAYYEQVARGLKFFGNAWLMHENINIGLYKYFEQKNLTYLLMDVPEYAKEVIGSQPNRQKGMHFGTGQIRHGELLIKNWLEEEIAPGVLQLTKIKSPALIQELIHYNNKGNFDRVRAFMAVMYAREETHRIVVKTIEKEQEDNYFTRNFKKAIPNNQQILFGNFRNAGMIIK